MTGELTRVTAAARSGSSLETLRDAIRAVDRTRGRARLREQVEAHAIGNGLYCGRWFLVDRFVSDGRMYLVASRNDPRLRASRALTEREKQIAFRAALGHTNKLIAHTLGLSTSSVGWYLSQAKRKLGAGSRAELVQLSLALAMAARARGLR